MPDEQNTNKIYDSYYTNGQGAGQPWVEFQSQNPKYTYDEAQELLGVYPTHLSGYSNAAELANIELRNAIIGGKSFNAVHFPTILGMMSDRELYERMLDVTGYSTDLATASSFHNPIQSTQERRQLLKTNKESFKDAKTQYKKLKRDYKMLQRNPEKVDFYRALPFTPEYSFGIAKEAMEDKKALLEKQRGYLNADYSRIKAGFNPEINSDAIKQIREALLYVTPIYKEEQVAASSQRQGGTLNYLSFVN